MRATYMPRMRNSNVKIRTASSSGRLQLFKLKGVRRGKLFTFYRFWKILKLHNEDLNVRRGGLVTNRYHQFSGALKARRKMHQFIYNGSWIILQDY